MQSSSYLSSGCGRQVIKVRCGEVLRRFSASVMEDGKLNLNIDSLKEKILNLFSFPPDADLTLTYVDEDGDTVTLVDEGDLEEAASQRLKYLMLNVKPNDKKVESSSANPEPLREALLELSLDLATKALSSSPGDAKDSRERSDSSVGALKTSSEQSSARASLGRKGAARPVSVPAEGNLCSSDPPPSGRKEAKKRNMGHLTRHPFVSCRQSGSVSPQRPVSNGCYSLRYASNDLPFPCNMQAPPHVPPNYCRNMCGNDGVVGLCHQGIQCDSCGAHPIVGLRYKSKLKHDYDLCSICFAKMGNEADYIMIDKPLLHHNHRFLRGMPDNNYFAAPPPPPCVMRSWGPGPIRAKLDGRFILDVNVLDGTVMAPSTHFTKIWRVRNSGNVSWPQGIQLVWIAGDKFSIMDYIEIEIPSQGVSVDAEIDIAMDFISPKLPGRYVSYWRMASPSGIKFGQRVWVHIQVLASKEDAQCDCLRGVDLGVPHKVGDANLPDANDAKENAQPAAEGSVPEPLVPVVDTLPDMFDGPSFSTNGNEVVNQGPSVSLEAFSSESCPLIDVSGPAASEPSTASLDASAPASSVQTSVVGEVEEILLKELEEMGFKQMDLNREILRINEYNLQQSLDDLCGIAEWDPILEELGEMGFSDEKKNLKLLKKNNGSIKGVVMDLLAGDKA